MNYSKCLIKKTKFCKLLPYKCGHFWRNFATEVWAVQKHTNLVDLVKSFPTNIFLQNLASMQKRTSPLKFAHLAEKSENGSISNLPTKAQATSRRCGACNSLAARHRVRTRGTIYQSTRWTPDQSFWGLHLGDSWSRLAPTADGVTWAQNKEYE